MLGLLFYSDTLILAKNTRSLKGRSIANNTFLTALLAEPEEPVVIFVSSETERNFLTDHLNSPARIVTFLESPGFFEKNNLTALHVLGPEMHLGFYFRSQIAQKNFPVTGMTHSLGHAPFLDWMILNLLHRPRPYDRLLCTTPSAEKAIRRMVDAVEPLLKTSSPLATEILPLGIPEPSSATLSKQRSTVSLLYFGRFSQYTKVDLIPLLMNFRDLIRKTNKDVRLTLAGATGQEDYISLLKTVVQELGLEGKVDFIPNPENKDTIFESADLFLAPGDNFQETFGLSVVEALSHGLPVIASDWDGYRSLFQEASEGHFIPTTMGSLTSFFEKTAPLQMDSLNHLFFSQTVATDSSLWLERTLDLVENDEKRKQFSAAARSQGRRFLWSSLLPRYWQLWKNLSRQATTTSEAATAVLNYSIIFSHYATKVLKNSDVISITDRGHEAIAGGFPLRIYTAMEEVLIPPLLSDLLKNLHQKASVEKICQIVDSHSIDLIQTHLLWLLKYGLVKMDHTP